MKLNQLVKFLTKKWRYGSVDENGTMTISSVPPVNYDTRQKRWIYAGNGGDQRKFDDKLFGSIEDVQPSTTQYLTFQRDVEVGDFARASTGPDFTQANTIFGYITAISADKLTVTIGGRQYTYFQVISPEDINAIFITIN